MGRMCQGNKGRWHLQGSVLTWHLLAYYFSDPVDVFEDVLAELLGLSRPEEMPTGQWREPRLAFLEEFSDDVGKVIGRAEAISERRLGDRASTWPC